MSEPNPMLMMMLEQVLGADKDAPIAKQAAPVIAIERSFASFLEQKKAEYADKGYLVTMIDAREGVSIAIHCIMYDITKKWMIELEKSLAITDAAFRTLALGEANPDRQAEIRQVCEQVKEVMRLTASGNLIDRFLMELGINMTNTAANLPLLELAASFMQLIKSHKNEDGTVTIDPEMFLGPVRKAARAPHCRLVQQGTMDDSMPAEASGEYMPEEALVKASVEQVPVAVVTDENGALAIAATVATSAQRAPQETEAATAQHAVETNHEKE